MKPSLQDLSGRPNRNPLVSGFSTRLKMRLRPFMPTVFTLVSILEFFNVNDYRFPLLNSYRSNGRSQKCASTPAAASDNYGSRARPSRYRFPVFSNQFLTLKLNVKSTPTARAVSEKLHPSYALFPLSDNQEEYQNFHADIFWRQN